MHDSTTTVPLNQYDFPGSKTNSLPHNTTPKVKYYFQLPSLLVQWYYRKKNYPRNVLKTQGCTLKKHGKSSLHIIALTGRSVT